MLRTGRSGICAALTGICAVVASVIALLYLPLPFAWIFLLWAVALAVVAAITSVGRALSINVAAVFLALTIFEGYLWLSGSHHSDIRKVSEIAPPLYEPHETLGWALNPGIVARHEVSIDDEPAYGATYTIGLNGLRISSPFDEDREPAHECLLFFGGSFMFGQGLEDHETLASLVSARSKNRYRTHNFGVMGYGAHHMLSAMQHGLVEDAVDCDRSRVSHVIYLAIPDHVRRAIGQWPRGWPGPKYHLTEDGGVRFDGLFGDEGRSNDNRSWKQLFINQISRSSIYGSLNFEKYFSRYGQHLVRFYLTIIGEARNLASTKYPDVEFHVLLWDEDGVDSRSIVEGLEDRGIAVHLMSRILPEYRADGFNPSYQLHQHDGHPNAFANELIAQYVMDEILPEVPKRGGLEQHSIRRDRLQRSPSG